MTASNAGESTTDRAARCGERSMIGRTSILAVLFILLVSACSGGLEVATPTDDDAADSEIDEQVQDGSAPAALGFDGPATVVIPNTPGSLTTTGRQRVMTALIGSGPNNFLGSTDAPVTVVFNAVNNDDTGSVDGNFLKTADAPLGLYVSYFEFPSAGLWEIIVMSQEAEVGKTLFEITEDSPIPTIGDPAPPTDSLTGTTPEEIAAISTDVDPTADFYALSIADAVANGRPTVVAFATPAFCQTALCGPTLETVKAATAGRDDLDVVHVEPFDLELAPQGSLVPIPSMEDWGLVTEPWVFVVDADGTVTANFEGIIGLEELEDALAAL